MRLQFQGLLGAEVLNFAGLLFKLEALKNATLRRLQFVHPNKALLMENVCGRNDGTGLKCPQSGSSAIFCEFNFEMRCNFVHCPVQQMNTSLHRMFAALDMAVRHHCVAHLHT